MNFRTKGMTLFRPLIGISKHQFTITIAVHMNVIVKLHSIIIENSFLNNEALLL